MILIKAVNSLALLLSISHAELLKHEASQKSVKSFSFKEVCNKLGVKNTELVEAMSLSEIDCMSNTFSVISFCLNEFPIEKTLTRGYLSPKEKLVYCEMSPSVMVSISCDKRDLKYCFDPKKGCEELKKIYAYKLELAHFSLLEKNLNCYFAKAIGDTLNEIP